MPNTQAPVKPPASRPWQAEPLSDVLLELDSSLEGLSELEARAPPRRDGPQRAEREAAAHAGADGARAADRPHDPHPPRGGRAVGASAGMGRSRHHLRHRDGERGHRHRAGAQGAILARSAKIDERAEARVVRDGVEMVVPRAISCRATSLQLGDGSMAPPTWSGRSGRAAHAGSRAHRRVGCRREGRLRRGSARRAAGRPSNMAFATAIVTGGTRGGHRGGHGSWEPRSGTSPACWKATRSWTRPSSASWPRSARSSPSWAWRRRWPCGRRPGLRPPRSPLVLLAVSWPSR